MINSYKASSQNIIADTSAEAASLHNAIDIYHQVLSPETGLYNGSEYTYDLYYPFVINEGHPFFESKQFDTGAVFYNNILYENVPLLYDLIKGELLIHDQTNVYVLRLNTEKVKWFMISGHTFTKLYHEKNNDAVIHTGFYEILYNGTTPLYKKISKMFKETSASVQGINKFVVEMDEYFIKKNDQYYRIKNKSSLLHILDDRKKELGQFIKTNKAVFRNNEDDALIQIVTFYDGIKNNTKAVN